MEKLPLEKVKLENLCALYLRQHPRCSNVSYVTLGRPNSQSVNWEVKTIAPKPSIVAGHCARLLIADMQAVFRMVE
jgi:hypothetical protein